MFSEGTVVRHRSKPEWGDGRILESRGDGKVSVEFLHQGRVLLVQSFAEKLLEIQVGKVWEEIARPKPKATTRTKCATCGRLLRRSFLSADQLWKSCPQCSGLNGAEHVYRLYPKDFGTSEAREAAGVEDGMQSWCLRCRLQQAVDEPKNCSEF